MTADEVRTLVEAATKGPWSHDDVPVRDLYGIRHANSEPGAISDPLAIVVARKTWRAEGLANAALIAAAPAIAKAYVAQADTYQKDLGVMGANMQSLEIQRLTKALETARGALEQIDGMPLYERHNLTEMHIDSLFKRYQRALTLAGDAIRALSSRGNDE